VRARLLDVGHLVHRDEDRDEKQEQHKDTVENFENHLLRRESKFGKAVPLSEPLRVRSTTNHHES
jgi:hypothetical protein